MKTSLARVLTQPPYGGRSWWVGGRAGWAGGAGGLGWVGLGGVGWGGVGDHACDGAWSPYLREGHLYDRDPSCVHRLLRLLRRGGGGGHATEVVECRLKGRGEVRHKRPHKALREGLCVCLLRDNEDWVWREVGLWRGHSGGVGHRGSRRRHQAHGWRSRLYDGRVTGSGLGRSEGSGDSGEERDDQDEERMEAHGCYSV